MQHPFVFQPRGSHPPVSNTERQRQFRARNPGYYARIKAHQRTASKAAVAAMRAARAAEAAAEVRQPLMLPAPHESTVSVIMRAPLMLPAPVEVLIFPELATIREKQLERVR